LEKLWKDAEGVKKLKEQMNKAFESLNKNNKIILLNNYNPLLYEFFSRYVLPPFPYYRVSTEIPPPPQPSDRSRFPSSLIKPFFSSSDKPKSYEIVRPNAYASKSEGKISFDRWAPACSSLEEAFLALETCQGPPMAFPSFKVMKIPDEKKQFYRTTAVPSLFLPPNLNLDRDNTAYLSSVSIKQNTIDLLKDSQPKKTMSEVIESNESLLVPRQALERGFEGEKPHFNEVFMNIVDFTPGLVTSLMRVLLVSLSSFQNEKGQDASSASQSQQSYPVFDVMSSMELSDPMVVRYLAKLDGQKYNTVDQEHEVSIKEYTHFRYKIPPREKLQYPLNKPIQKIKTEEDREIHCCPSLFYEKKGEQWVSLISFPKTDMETIEKTGLYEPWKNSLDEPLKSSLDNQWNNNLDEEVFLEARNMELQRHYRMLAKFSASILFLLLKFGYNSDPFQYEQICQSIMDSNGVLLLLKFFNISLTSILHTDEDLRRHRGVNQRFILPWLFYNFFFVCLFV
jgi:hypothetical protein